MQKGLIMKVLKKFVASCLVLVLALAFNCTAFAADKASDVSKSTVESVDVEDTISTYSADQFRDSGLFTSYYRKSFTVGRTGKTRFIYGCRGVNHSNNVTVVLNNLGNGKTYATDTFSSTSARAKVINNLPAGNYEIYAYGTGQFAYSFTVYSD